MRERHQKYQGKPDLINSFGSVHANVFRNPKLSLGAKSLYAYLCSFADVNLRTGMELKVKLSPREIQRDLGISSNTLSKYLSELRKRGLVQVHQTRVLRDGRRVYGSNLYTLQPNVAPPAVLNEAPPVDKYGERN